MQVTANRTPHRLDLCPDLGCRYSCHHRNLAPCTSSLPAREALAARSSHPSSWGLAASAVRGTSLQRRIRCSGLILNVLWLSSAASSTIWSLSGTALAATRARRRSFARRAARAPAAAAQPRPWTFVSCVRGCARRSCLFGRGPGIHACVGTRRCARAAPMTARLRESAHDVTAVASIGFTTSCSHLALIRPAKIRRQVTTACS